MTGDEQLTRLAPHVATAELFRERAGAERVVVVLDRGAERAPAVLELSSGRAAIELNGEVVAVPPDLTLGAEPAAGTPELAPLDPPLRVAATDGGLDVSLVPLAYLAGHVRTLAELYPGRSLVSVELPTSDPRRPLTIAARAGEPLVVAFGGEVFPLDPGWPQ